MKKVAAYIRVSTDGQIGEDKYGLDSQREDIVKYCAANDMEIIEWYSDEGFSGAKYRPGFDEIAFGEDMQNPPFEAVVVAKLDRVARDVYVYFTYKGILKRKGVELISVADNYDAFGVGAVYVPMLEAFTATMAQLERDNITKRTSGGRRIKAARGGYSGGRAPMGYKVENGCLVINEEEAEVVRFIMERKHAGRTMISTVDAVNEAGFKTRNGKPFVISTVQSIWNNERTYWGWYRYGKDSTGWVRGQHKPILTGEEPDWGDDNET